MVSCSVKKYDSVTVTKCHIGFHGWRLLADGRPTRLLEVMCGGGCGGDRQAKDTLLSERYLTNFEIKFDVEKDT